MRRIVLDTNCLLHSTKYQEVSYHFGLIDQDEDDNTFVDCAVAADAEYIVSNDAHFKVLKDIDWPKILVVSLRDFASQMADA